jgi:hypothetical protein
VVLLWVQTAGGDDARQFQPLWPEVAREASPDVLPDGVFVRVPSFPVEYVEGDARGDGGEGVVVGGVYGAPVGVGLPGKLWPVRVDDAPGDDVYPMAQFSHCQGQLLHVDELPAEVRVGRPVGVVRVEISLRVDKRYVHGPPYL